ncbi:MAG TPA: hypothetical protein PKA82_12345 [Pyrinomonadaceae bacterium]|nr:hypothetical protein [Pyrinomonadaceae bacterium]
MHDLNLILGQGPIIASIIQANGNRSLIVLLISTDKFDTLK